MENIIFGLAMTAHLGLAGEYNEIHPHIRYNNDNVIAGAFVNSIDNISLYAGRRFEHDNFGFELTATTGYLSLIVPQVRGTYDVHNNVRLFVGNAVEKIQGKIKPGAVVGIELLY